MSARERALAVMSGEDRSVTSRATRALLSAASPFYAAGSAMRSMGFASGIKRTHTLGRPTISIGNLTTGGTGKTPMVACVCRWLVAMGHHPCVLLRGYRGADEAHEHRRVLGEAVRVEPNPDRVAAAKAVLADDSSVTCFVLDDGFQHRRAQRDLDIVLIDATCPWGFGRLLPRGLLREPKAALARADGVIVTRSDQASARALAAIDDEVVALTGDAPIAHAEHAWTGLIDARDREVSLDAIGSKAVMGVVGIGNPRAFESTLSQYAERVVHCEAKADHHAYTRTELLGLIDLAKQAQAKAVVTTEKDWVKWSVLLEDERVSMPIYRARLSMRFRDGEATLRERIAACVNRAPQ